MLEPIKVKTSPTIPDNVGRLTDSGHLNSVPPSIHEDVFRVDFDHGDNEFVVLARATLKASRECAERSRAIALSVLADETKTELARHADADAAITKATGPILQRIDKAVERLHQKCQAMTDYLRGPPAPKDAIGQMAAMELRSSFASMDNGTRRKVILDGIAAGDQSVGVCLRVAPHLSGMDHLAQEEIRMRWAEKFHPEIVRLHASLLKALEATERGGALLLSYTHGLTSAAHVERARMLSQRAQDAIASATTP